MIIKIGLLFILVVSCQNDTKNSKEGNDSIVKKASKKDTELNLVENLKKTTLEIIPYAKKGKEKQFSSSITNFSSSITLENNGNNNLLCYHYSIFYLNGRKYMYGTSHSSDKFNKELGCLTVDNDPSKYNSLKSKLNVDPQSGVHCYLNESTDYTYIFFTDYKIDGNLDKVYSFRGVAEIEATDISD